MKRSYFSTYELIPGHSGIFWMAIMIVATGVVRKPDTTSIVGLTSGIITAFLWYTIIGVGMDLALLLLRNAGGILGHLSKLM